MKCPLSPWQCKKDNCAWWDKELQCCAILAITIHLRKLGMSKAARLGTG